MYPYRGFLLLVLTILVRGDINSILFARKAPISEVIFQIIYQNEIPWENTVDIFAEANTRLSALMQGDIISNILLKDNLTKAFRFEDPIVCFAEQKKTYNLFIVDGFESFLNIYQQMTEKCFDYKGFYIIALNEFIPNVSTIIKQIFQKLWKISVANIILIVESTRQGSFNIFTYFPFGRRYCRKAVPVLYNVFESGKFVWNVPNFPKKFKNFYKCPLKVVTWPFMPYMSLTLLENGTLYPNGIDGTILRVLSQRLNFTRVILSPKENKRGEIYQNGTSTGGIQMIIEGDGDFTICGYGYSYSRATSMSSSIIYLSTDMVFAQPVPMPYSSLERLFLPFRTYVWTSIGTSFAVGFIVTSVLKLLGRKYIEFVSGRQNRSATYYMVNIFLGGSVTTSPRRNFARTMLILWVAITLVLRSSYQGSMFKLLQSGRFNRVEKTAEELIQEGFKVYFLNHHTTLAKLLKLKKNQYVIMDVDTTKYYEMLYQPNFKGLLVDTEMDVMYYNTLNRNRPMIRPLTERLFHFPTSVFFKRNSYLTEPFDNILERFLGNGLVFKWTREVLNRPYRQIVETSQPTEIAVRHLIGCFQVCGVLYAASLFLFLLEVIAEKLIVLRSLIDFYTY